ncbi:MAG: efflux RND transporter periplasmic adaptor subunit [Acidobacteria bacterium]|nr:efflux RND transporter periplasmic adaptor subunit [Acidobacteriota bacterium]
MSKISERLKSLFQRRSFWGVLVLLVAAALALSYGFMKRSSAAGDYITGTVDRGTIEMSVVATGTVNAVTTVQVGSQVSGTIETLNGTDFNSIVKKGQVVAKLNQDTYQAQLKRALADLQSAQANTLTAEAALNNQKANLASTRANLEALRVAREDADRLLARNRELKADKVISERDFEAAQAAADGAIARFNEAKSRVAQAEAQVRSAEANIEQARAQVLQARAAVDLAQANLDHTVITSPIDGVVVSRNVDVGQTVAASLQAPTLFTIANDLTRMQAIAKVDEADIGKLAVGGPASFTVDAFPEDNFKGRIQEVRLNAQVQQNVVIYDVVIEVANPDFKLRPGMTANLTMSVVRRENALTIPNAALRYRPQLPEAEMARIMEEMRARWESKKSTGIETGSSPALPPAGTDGDVRQEDSNRAGANRERRLGRSPESRGSRFAPSNRANAAPGDAPRSTDLNRGESGAKLTIQPPSSSRSGQSRPQVVWVLGPDKKPAAGWVRVGITDGRSSEIIDGDLKEGDVIILGQNIDGSQVPTQQRSPFGGTQRGPGGGGMPRGVR